VSITERIVQAPADRVFAVLSDGWTYSDWVVGTAHIRDVDHDWPAPGSKLYHKAGPWPMSIKDRSESLECDPDRSLVLKVNLWPLGAGKVSFTLDPLDEHATRVTLQEQFTEGPLLGVRNKVGDVLLHFRNVEALRRLADIAERSTKVRR
jgi:uncharacterized protein YndB with AHSA1/START domain